MSTQALERVLAYHQITKHAPHRYARALGYMDWDTQPDPFRRFEGARRTELPLRADALRTTYRELYDSSAVEPHALSVDSLASFFELALGLTAWKEYGDARWSLRADPSSGNLHPTEAYAVLPALEGGVAAGVHHYLSHDHCLEQRTELTAHAADELTALLPPGGFFVCVTSIHWRESWKYGERAFRYCQHDAGHVLATLRYAAAALGWSVCLVDGVGDDLLARITGTNSKAYAKIDELDHEHADYLLCVTPRDAAAAAAELGSGAERLADLLHAAKWTGAPNQLSSDHHDWDVIEGVADAAREPRSAGDYSIPALDASAVHARLPDDGVTASRIIRGRRSAVAMDGETQLDAASFYQLLDRLLPRQNTAPFDALPWTPRVHLAIFVHLVEGVAPGLYLFERNATAHDAFRAQLGDGPLWTRPAGCPEHLRLFCITERDLRGMAASISCQQEIAGKGAFSLGMIAEFRGPLETGAHWYRRLFWECGVIGQVLYLESEALGLRGTGIGCYFDDLMHKALGLEDDTFQSLYHFTLGGPVDDDRLVTHPPYAHLGDRASR